MGSCEVDRGFCDGKTKTCRLNRQPLAEPALWCMCFRSRAKNLVLRRLKEEATV
jgi:hypothetical protein